jgi:hypothetical protein
MAMVGKGKALIQLMIIGAIGGWLAGACINADDGLLVALIRWDSARGSLVGLIAFSLLIFPWLFSVRRRCWWSYGLFFGVLAGFLAVLTYFLIWPYEAHGRENIHKTVAAILVSYPLPVFGIGGLMGLGASTWIRPSPEYTRFWSSLILPFMICIGVFFILHSSEKEEVQAPPADAQTLECCAVAYQAFVDKVGVSYAIFEAEKYCSAKCTNVVDCLNQCASIRALCPIQNKACKDSYRRCVLACPPRGSIAPKEVH